VRTLSREGIPGSFASMLIPTDRKYVHDLTLRLLLSQINAFRMGLPPQLRRPTQNSGDVRTLDRDLVCAIMIAHA
jgi:hypothetical protein